jgi:hypothetical protein
VTVSNLLAPTAGYVTLDAEIADGPLAKVKLTEHARASFIVDRVTGLWQDGELVTVTLSGRSVAIDRAGGFSKYLEGRREMTFWAVQGRALNCPKYARDALLQRREEYNATATEELM